MTAAGTAATSPTRLVEIESCSAATNIDRKRGRHHGSATAAVVQLQLFKRAASLLCFLSLRSSAKTLESKVLMLDGSCRGRMTLYIGVGRSKFNVLKR